MHLERSGELISKYATIFYKQFNYQLIGVVISICYISFADLKIKVK